jgi:hypothetical protein
MTLARAGLSMYPWTGTSGASEADSSARFPPPFRVSVVVRLRKKDDRLWQILLQKSFWGDERKFLEPPMRFTRGDVRDHTVSSKIDHGPPSWR